MAEIRAQIFTSIGQRLAEFEPAFETVGWRFLNMAMCKFSLPYGDPACTRDNLKSGNRLLVQFSNGLPDWGGVLDFPRKRDAVGLTCTGYTGEKLLDWRVTPKGRYFASAPPGHIFERLVTEENDLWPTGVLVSDAWTGGTPRTLEYHYHDLLRRVLDLVRLTGQHFTITPVLANGKVSFWASWEERHGLDRTNDVVLWEGKNVTACTLDEVGPIANVIYTIGEGSTWGDERLVGYASDADSIGTYGYREYAEVQGGVTTQETLDANAEELLAEMANPRYRFTLQVVNEDPGAFAAYGVGDRVGLEAFVDRGEWAYSGVVQVIAREWLGGDECRLEVEEWTE